MQHPTLQIRDQLLTGIDRDYNVRISLKKRQPRILVPKSFGLISAESGQSGISAWALLESLSSGKKSLKISLGDPKRRRSQSGRIKKEKPLKKFLMKKVWPQKYETKVSAEFQCSQCSSRCFVYRENSRLNCCKISGQRSSDSGATSQPTSLLSLFQSSALCGTREERWEVVWVCVASCLSWSHFFYFWCIGQPLPVNHVCLLCYKSLRQSFYQFLFGCLSLCSLVCSSLWSLRAQTPPEAVPLAFPMLRKLVCSRNYGSELLAIQPASLPNVLLSRELSGVNVNIVAVGLIRECVKSPGCAQNLAPPLTPPSTFFGPESVR